MKTEKIKIAIIGGGISGLTCAWYLSQHYDITLYEANDYIGGHTATVDIEISGEKYAIDTGFIVYNDKTYPCFIQLLNELGITSQPTEMSFSVQHGGTGLEYNGHSLSSLFSQRRNLFNPRFYYFLYEIMRFNRCCKQLHRKKKIQNTDTTLGDFLQQNQFSDFFAAHYILPMGAAIWSSSLADMRKFPLCLFLDFFENHGLLDILHRPQWFVVPKGSRSYVQKILSQLEGIVKILPNTPVTGVKRRTNTIEIQSQSGIDEYDQVIFACHSDQALTLLHDPSPDEINILGHLPYQKNTVTLHTDTELLPKNKRTWASWNYYLPPEYNENTQANVTYNMNILQGITDTTIFCVSLNPNRLIAPQKVLRQFEYMHPVFNQESQKAQMQRPRINGRNRTWYCGAYWYHGFHEDGVRSALDIINQLKNNPLNNTLNDAPIPTL